MLGASMSFDPLTTSATDLQRRLSDASLTGEAIVKVYLAQIQKLNDRLRAVIQTAPPALLFERARELQGERDAGRLRGPLHGIPVLVKDNIDTHPSHGLGTTCGSSALMHAKPKRNAPVVDSLVAAGAIVFGKANLSEWAFYMGSNIPCGWSAIGGQTQSAFVSGGVDPSDTFGGHSNPGGSSSGSAVAVSAGLAPLSVGTESSGSLIMPANRAGLFSIKPSIGLVSQRSIIPGSDFCDAAGPIARTVEDAANLLDAMVDPSARHHVPPGGYSGNLGRTWERFSLGVLDPAQWRLKGAIAPPDEDFFAQTDAEVERVLRSLRDAGANVKYPVSLISPEELDMGGTDALDEIIVGNFEHLMNRYLEDLDQSSVRSLQDIIKHNEAYRALELPGEHTQGEMIEATQKQRTPEQMEKAAKHCHETARRRGIDHTLESNGIDAIIGPADSALNDIIAASGYPYASLPLSIFGKIGRPFGMVVIARQFEEAKLISIMAAWEATISRSKVPKL